MTTRIDVDFNDRTRDGLVRVSRRRADGDFAIGDIVELFDGGDPSLDFLGRIERIDNTGRGYARIEWVDELPPAWPANNWALPTPDVRYGPVLQNVLDPTASWISPSISSTVLEPSR